jgi:hypothetical protein
MTSPSRAETPRERLARLMDDRRATLDLRWVDVAERANITTEGLRGIRYGTGEIRSLTKRGIEDALHWEHGSITAVLAGGEPTPVDAEPSSDPAAEDEEDPHVLLQRGMELIAKADEIMRRQREAG